MIFTLKVYLIFKKHTKILHIILFYLSSSKKFIQNLQNFMSFTKVKFDKDKIHSFRKSVRFSISNKKIG